MIHKHLLPQYLRTHRRLMGLTQGETGFLLSGDSRSFVALYERNERIPNLEHALALSNIFGVDVAELFGGMNERIAGDVSTSAKALIRLLELQPRIPEVREKLLRLHRLVDRIERGGVTGLPV